MPSNTDTKPASEPAWRVARRAARSAAGIIRSSLVLGTLFLFVLSAALDARADLSVSQRQTLTRLRMELRAANQQFRRREFKPAAVTVQAAQKDFSDLLNEVAMRDRKQLRSVFKTLERAHASLELEGIEMPALPVLDPPTDDSAKPGATVSFVGSVAPILVSKCGRCHVNDNKGGFSAASYASLLRGTPDAGIVIRPGNAQGSRVMELIRDGDMPRGGLQITRAEQDILARWIQAGAKFDGDDPSTRITQFASSSAAPTAAPAVTLDIVAARGDESVSFAGDLAAILARQCTGCHGGDQRRNGLSLANFSALASGGDSGPIVDRTEPEKSLLITKLRGTGPGERMPLNRPPLTDATIAKFVEWIREGATFDGKDPGQDLATMAALYRAQHSSHSELSQERREIALRNWRLAMPDRRPNQAETVDFLVIGTRGENNLQVFADAAQRHSVTIRRLLRGATSGPFIKGRMTLFVLDRRYDYVEFGRMVEQRQLPKDRQAHWRYTHLDAYAAIVPAPDEFTSAGQLEEQLAAVYVASWGDDIPRWFSSGVARVVAARVAPRDARVRQWERQDVNQPVAASDFIAERCPPEIAEIVGYWLAKDLMGNGRQFSRLTRELKKDQPFAAAWSAAYGVPPEQTIELWLAQRS